MTKTSFSCRKWSWLFTQVGHVLDLGLCLRRVGLDSGLDSKMVSLELGLGSGLVCLAFGLDLGIADVDLGLGLLGLIGLNLRLDLGLLCLDLGLTLDLLDLIWDLILDLSRFLTVHGACRSWPGNGSGICWSWFKTNSWWVAWVNEGPPVLPQGSLVS